MSKRKAGTALPHHSPRFCVQQTGLELTVRRCRDHREALQVKGSLGLSEGQRVRPSILCQGVCLQLQEGCETRAQWECSMLGSSGRPSPEAYTTDKERYRRQSEGNRRACLNPLASSGVQE